MNKKKAVKDQDLIMKEEHNAKVFTGFVDGVLLDFSTLENSITLMANSRFYSFKTSSPPSDDLTYILKRLKELKTLFDRMTYFQKTIPGYGSATSLRVNTEKKKE
ncbi:hypothetical protein LCGC14_2110970 [marine sediment metagenome]|uniref:Uncharacterized protein n=1 Tax=marine sediment metagenome TaxID=412755 RepID=A0A0F9E770_9ZZZZ